MRKRIRVINGHPDPRPERLCAALASAYAASAVAAGHEVRRIDVGALEFPLIRDAQTFMDGDPPLAIADAQDTVHWCEHLLIVHPLWLGAAPAVLKGFFEQVFRYGLLLDRSARVVVTMGMPALIYRTVFGGFGVRGFERGVLQLSGISPVRTTLFGGVEGASPERRKRWLASMARLGAVAR